MSEITQQIKTYCIDLMQAQVASTLDAAAEYLTDLADNAEHPNDKKLYIETMHDLGFERKTVLKTFLQSQEHGFDDLTGSPGSSDGKKTGGVDTSSIDGTEDIEEKLALETMVDKSRTQTDLPMQSIIRSLNALMGDDWVQNHQNPLDPELLVKSWLVAVYILKLPAKGNLALYGLFDSKLLRLLPQMYEKVGSYLEQLPIRKQRQPEPPVRVDIESTENDYEQAFGDIDEPTVMPDFFQAEAPDSEDLSPAFESAIESEGEPVPERRTDELISLLDRLQRDRKLDDSQFYSGNRLLDFRALLQSVNAVPEGEINPWTIGQINDDVIDMTGLLFSFIMEDAYLPEDIRLHISRLQIAYLKLGLQDKSIFSDKSHPARQLLNDLAQSISLWDPTHTGGIDRLLSKTISLIDEIIDQYHMDSQIFQKMQNNFSQFLSGDEHIDEEMQQRRQNTATKTEKADNARLYIESTLDKICANQRIPTIVNQILEEFWTKVLFLEFLKAGQDSQDFATFIETVEILVSSVQAKNSTQSRKEMAKQLPDLIGRLKDGFTTISVAAFETVEIFRELQECHMLTLKERPENQLEDEFEVSDDEYEAFKRHQNFISDWNRSDLENALLEESIERSLSRSDSDADPGSFEDNRNIFTSRKDVVQDATLAKAARERKIIDNELKEARDAYEQALKEHQDNKTTTDSGDNDYMMDFFQDPEYIQKQYQGNRDLSDGTDLHLQQTAGGLVEDDVFDDLQEISDFTVPSKFSEIEVDDKTLAEAPRSVKELPSVNDDLAGRAQGALDDNFDELADDQVSELIERLKVGLWVDLFHGDGSQARVKIMAIVPTVGKYIFGNRAGKKVADYNKKSLAEALRTGQIRVCEVDNVFDKTLESVIANLRVLKKAEDD